MLTEEDKSYLTELLATRLGASGTPREDLVGPFYNTAFAQELTGSNARSLAVDAIRLCMADAWNHSPTWLELIITNFQLAVLDTKVTEIWDRSKHKPPAGPNPLENGILFNGSPFINRITLRSKLARLSNAVSNMQPILVINGGFQSGKSYSYNFIDHFSNNATSISVYKYVFDNDLGLEIGPDLVALDLVAQMARSTSTAPAAQTNLKLYTQQLARWVLSEASQTPGQHWFVLDNFAGDKLRPETKDFILFLTNIVTTGQFQRRCRIILPGFDSTLLTVDLAQFDEEFVARCTIEDINKVISEIVGTSPSPLNPEFVSTFVLDSLPVGPEKMSELNARLRALYIGINTLKEILFKITGVDFEPVLVNTLQDLPPGKEKTIELKKRLQTIRESTNP